jgi:hypothetical protein
MIAFNIMRQTFKDGCLDEEWCLPQVFFTKEEALQFIATSILEQAFYGRWFVYRHEKGSFSRLCHVVYNYKDGANGDYES